MRVLIVSTSECTGGAAVAAKRLMEALNNNGVKAKMLVRDKESDDIKVVGLGRGPLQRLHFLWERWCVFCHLHFSRKYLFKIDIANTGTDITRLREFREADIIHLHWVNQGMLSIGGIRKILRSGKPVVWTMHDMWPATSLCHYALGCNSFKSVCHSCRCLPHGGSAHDLSYKVWRRKAAMLRGGNIIFVACSKWLAAEAKTSTLMSGQRIECIPNAIDIRTFKPQDRAEARQHNNIPQGKRVILFVSQSVTNIYKGIDFFIGACERLASNHPETKDNTCVAILGGHSEEVAMRLPFPTVSFGYVSDERRIISLYNCADVFVLPSLSENLPNTVMEAMGCGVPCVGFNVGGIPEMISHKRNGYVAEYKNADDLANGIFWTLYEADSDELRRNALHKVATCYSQTSVATKYIDVYNTASAYKRYRL